MMKFEWEEMASRTSLHSGFRTSRGKVIGGWLVKNLVWHDDASTQSESMVFVSDVNHEWSIEE